jgi:transcriptional regulator with XRE-family HTH domain
MLVSLTSPPNQKYALPSGRGILMPTIDRDQFYIELGNRLRVKREKSELTQAEVAEAAGISRTSLTNIEGGRQRILVDQLASICSKLNTTMDDVVPTGAMKQKKPHDKLTEIPVVANFLQSVGRGEEP